MADFILAKDQEKQVWSNTITREYVRESGLSPYMGKGSIINVQNELNGSAGNIIHVPALAKLRGSVVRGSATLVGNEDAQESYSMRVETNLVRTAITVKMTESFKTEMDLYNEGAAAVRTRLAEALRDDLIDAFRSIPVAGPTVGENPEDLAKTYAAASAAEKNAWLVANADRVLYGNKKSNMTAGNHASSFATLNATAQATTDNRLSAKTVSLARKMARETTKSSTFAIRPYKTKDGAEWYVFFVDGNGFRDLKQDPLIYAANKDARPRNVDDNPIFNGTNILLYDGVIIVEFPELSNVETGVGYGHLCGIQAVNMGYSMRLKPVRRKEDDYEMIAGVGAVEIRGQQKATVNKTQLGMLSVFYANVDDV